METIAIYKEKPIRTYGLQTVTDLCMVRIESPLEGLDELGLRLMKLGEKSVSFSLSFSQYSSRGFLRMYLLCRRESEDTLQSILGHPDNQAANIQVLINSPVEMIHFHGPHFGDRYGIAHTALNALREHEIPILAANCSAATMYIIFPENGASDAKNILFKHFTTAA
ncbi:MAG: hypothetical protein JRD68_08995 [Deltaproteobacteria bacterium]|nr:hypothetical protein [Deltaproteobacteria bacterium]